MKSRSDQFCSLWEVRALVSKLQVGVKKCRKSGSFRWSRSCITALTATKRWNSARMTPRSCSSREQPSPQAMELAPVCNDNRWGALTNHWEGINMVHKVSRHSGGALPLTMADQLFHIRQSRMKQCLTNSSLDVKKAPYCVP